MRSILLGLLISAFLLMAVNAGAADNAPDKGTVRPNRPFDEERLRRVIKETMTPKPAPHKPLPADVQALLAWSKPVNGLMTRIEDIWGGDVFFLRLKNVSQRPLRVPTGNLSKKNIAALFELYVRQAPSPWRRMAENNRYNRFDSGPPDSEIRAGCTSVTPFRAAADGSALGNASSRRRLHCRRCRL